jgi:hypothetical protein
VFGDYNLQCIVHCISACAKQGKGFAAELCKRFPENRIKLQGLNLQIGQCVRVQCGTLVVLNLISKKKGSPQAYQERFHNMY